MHLKLGLISVLAASASASASIRRSPYQQPELETQGLVLANEYLKLNLNEICFSNKPVHTCADGYVAQSSVEEKVGFHCVNENNSLTQEWKNKVEQNLEIPELSHKSVDVKGNVKIPTRCVKKSQFNMKEQTRRTLEQEHDQRVELVENEDNYSDNSEWEKSSSENEYNQKQEQWQKYPLGMFQYSYLNANKNLKHFVNLNENEFSKLYEELHHFLSNKQFTNFITIDVQEAIPAYFGNVAKQLYDTMKDNNYQHSFKHLHDNSNDYSVNQEETKLKDLIGNSNEYKKKIKLIYSYVVKEIALLSQTYQNHLPHIPDLLAKVWENVRIELTKKESNEIDDMSEYIQQNLELDQTQVDIADLLVDDKLKNVQVSTRRNILKIILTGLNMFKNSNF